MKTFDNFAAFALAAALISTTSAGFAGGRPDTAAYASDETSPDDRAPALGGQPFIVEHEAVSGRAASASQVTAMNPLADRAAALDGEAFTAKRAEGSRYHTVRQTSAEVSQAVGNPLAERAAALDGKVFTVERGASQAAPSFLARFQ